MEKPKVSIITPTRHRPDFLKRCILSVQSQIFNEYEHIIVADNCKYTKNVYNEFKDDKRIKYFEVNMDEKHSRNNGCPGRTKGIEEAQSDIIGYLDDDDTFLPHHISSLYPVIKEGDYDLVYSKHYGIPFKNIYDGGGDYIYILERDIHDFTGYGDEFYSSLTNSLHTREILKRVGGWKFGDNAVGTLQNKLLKVAKIQYIDETTVIVNTHGGSRNKMRMFAKTDYEQRIKNLQDNQTYAYSETTNRWISPNDQGVFKRKESDISRFEEQTIIEYLKEFGLRAIYNLLVEVQHLEEKKIALNFECKEIKKELDILKHDKDYLLSNLRKYGYQEMKK